MNRNKKIIIFWLPVIIWAVIIFQLSSRPVPSVSEFYLQDFLIKKNAHIFEFAIFYVLIYRAVKNSLSQSLSLSKKKTALISLLIIIIYAASDEYHQTFIPGRTGRLRDIFIDTGGGLLAWWALWKLLPKAPKKLQTWAKNWQLI